MVKDRSKEIKQLSLRQGAIKILINSVYGAFGNQYFYFFSTDIAQSITLQGQDMIKFANKAINFYFKEKWHLDIDLHKELGIDSYVVNKVNDDSAIYTDTDSSYIQFDSAINSIEHEFTHEEAIRLCIMLDDHRLGGYFEECFTKYGKVFNTKNQQTFKLEAIFDKGFWIKKKNYALRTVYEPNPKKEVYPIEDRYLLIKGLESIKSSYPVWIRERLKKYIVFFLNNGVNIDLEKDIIPMIEEDFKEFKKLSIDDIAQSFSVKVYSKYIDSEFRGTVKKGATVYSKAVMHHNYLILKNDVESRYPKIQEGNKVRFYMCDPGSTGFDVFAYNPGEYPKEIAPNMDMNSQYFTLMIEPVNRILGAIGLPKINKQIKRAVEFKTSKSKNPLTHDQLYPLHMINSETLEHEEVDEKFWKYIGNSDTDVPDDIFNEYLETVSRYGLNTVILINKNLDTYKKRIAKKLGLDHILEKMEADKTAAKLAKDKSKLEAKLEKELDKIKKG
jgi:DNA polymerase elongation subunit (family B)